MDLFNYIGAFVGEREKLIEDGFDDEKDNDGEMTKECKRFRYEQSDLVMILLNLAYIPDEVVHKIHFNEGWSLEFKEHMDKFKKDWEEKHGYPWEYQSEKWETKYKEFMEARDAKSNAIN